MKSKTAERILEETPQEVKDRVRKWAEEKIIKDKLNALKSQLKQEQIEKLGRVTNQYRIEQIQLQIKTLEELCG